jgi:metallo-beta-lactamase class B
MRKAILIISVLLLGATCAFAQINDDEARKWNQPVKPFKIIGNIHYVGAHEVSSYLITSPQGHILLDSGFEETVPQIKENVAALGFRMEDVKVIITSHAHSDHVGGIALLKQLTGAKLMVSEADAEALARGGKNDPNFGDRFSFDPITVDRKLQDGEMVQVGDTTMTARLTPGHTRGCTTWTMTVREGSKFYDVVFIGSTTVPGYKLIGNTGYPNIVGDYESTFRLLKLMSCDVFLAPHGSFFALHEKRKRLDEGAPQNPFVNKSDFKRFVERTEKEFRAELKRQQEAGSK